MEQETMIYTIVRDNQFNSREIQILEHMYSKNFETLILHENYMDFEKTKNLINMYSNTRELVLINGTDGLTTEDAEYIYEISKYIPVILLVPDYKWVTKKIGAVCNFDVTEEVWKQMNRDLSQYFENNIELRDINNRKFSDLIETNYEEQGRYITHETDWDDLF